MSTPFASDAPADLQPSPPLFNYILGFLLIGLAWGFTTPFIRRAARTHTPRAHPILESAAVKNSWIKSKIYGAFFGVVDLLRNPRYAAPLIINLTGSVWFFLLIGQAGESFLVNQDVGQRTREEMLRTGGKYWEEEWDADTWENRRVEFDSANHEFHGFSLYCYWGVVGWKKGKLEHILLRDTAILATCCLRNLIFFQVQSILSIYQVLSSWT